jgi:O-methyltransferase domain
MENDFFAPQPVVADIYIFRPIFHNWPDHYCLKILQQFRPALRKGAKMVVQDGILPEHGQLGMLAERNVRAYDMIMMTLFNGREREPDDRRDLFAAADPGYKVTQILRPPVGTMGLVLVEWDGPDGEQVKNST